MLAEELSKEALFTSKKTEESENDLSGMEDPVSIDGIENAAHSHDAEL